MMRRDVGAGLLVVLEQRELGDPEDRPAVLGNEVELLAEHQSDVAEHRMNQLRGTELKQDEVAVLRPGERVDRVSQILGDRLRVRRLRPLAVRRYARAPEPLRADTLRFRLELIGLRA